MSLKLEQNAVVSVNRPCADPHAGWCGERGRKTPAYPIMQ